MNKKLTNELINRAKAMANTSELKSLIADLEEFLSIQGEEDEEARKKWLAAREKLWSSFDKLTALYGISPEMIREQIDYFPSEYQETVGLIKEGLSEKTTRSSLDKTLKARI